MKTTKFILPLFCILSIISLAACTSALRSPGKNLEEDIIHPPANAYYHYSMGVLHACEGNVNDAIREYEKAHVLEPQSSDITVELASLYIKKRNIIRATELLEKALIYNPDHVDTHLLLGNLYITLKEPDNAIRELQKVIELNPQKLEAYLYLSMLFAEKEYYEESIKTLQDFLKVKPESAMGRYYLGKIYYEMKLYTEAEKWFRKALDIDPSFESALAGLAHLYEIQDKKNAAITIYRKLITLNPFKLAVRFKLGKTYLAMDRFDEAEKEFSEILSIDRSNTEARFSLGLVHFSEGKDLNGAITEFRAVLKEDPANHRARYFMASAYDHINNHTEAYRQFDMIPPLSKLYGNARIQMGLILKESGRLTEATDLINNAIIQKKDALFYGFLASLHETAGDMKTAEETLRSGLLLFPRDKDLHYRLGVIYEKLKRTNEGIKEMRKVLELDPDNAEALNFIGYSYADRGIHLGEAEKMIKRALELTPGNGYITDSLGWVYFRQNNIEMAIHYLEQAVKILPEDPTIAEHLGDAYEKAERYEKALKTYRHILTSLNPKSKETLKEKISGVLKKMKRGKERIRSPGSGIKKE